MTYSTTSFLSLVGAYSTSNGRTSVIPFVKWRGVVPFFVLAGISNRGRAGYVLLLLSFDEVLCLPLTHEGVSSGMELRSATALRMELTEWRFPHEVLLLAISGLFIWSSGFNSGAFRIKYLMARRDSYHFALIVPSGSWERSSVTVSSDFHVCTSRPT